MFYSQIHAPHRDARSSRPSVPKVLGAIMLVLIGTFGQACKSAETRYRDDGTPYTVQVDDPWKTIGVLVLIAILVGAAAQSKSENASE